MRNAMRIRPCALGIQRVANLGQKIRAEHWAARPTKINAEIARAKIQYQASSLKKVNASDKSPIGALRTNANQ